MNERPGIIFSFGKSEKKKGDCDERRCCYWRGHYPMQGTMGGKDILRLGSDGGQGNHCRRKDFHQGCGCSGLWDIQRYLRALGHSLFQHQVPFGRGRIMLDGADTALPIHVYTTRGILTPRVFKKGTRVKVIFRDKRIGKPTDIFAVPIEEIPEHKREIRGLQESDLDWESPVEPGLPAPTDEAKKAYESVLTQIKEMTSKVAHSERAQKNLSGWKRRIQVKTSGGSIGLLIDDGKFDVKAGEIDAPDFVMVARDPAILSDWVNFKDSLTNAIIAERLWISLNREFITVFKLDRLPRSIKRTGE